MQELPSSSSSSSSSISFSPTEYSANNRGRAFVKLMNTTDEIMASIASTIFSYKLLHTDCYLSNFPQFAKEFAVEHNLTTTCIRAFKLPKPKQEFFFSVIFDLQGRIKDKFRGIQPEVLQLSIYWEKYCLNGFIEEAALEPICALIDQLDEKFPGVVDELMILDFNQVDFKYERPLDEFSLLTLTAVNHEESGRFTRKGFSLSEHTIRAKEKLDLIMRDWNTLMKNIDPDLHLLLKKTCHEIMVEIADKVFKQKLAQNMLYQHDFPKFCENFTLLHKVNEASSSIFKNKASQFYSESMFIRYYILGTFMKIEPEIIDLIENWKSSWWDRLIENAGFESLNTLFEQLLENLNSKLQRVPSKACSPRDLEDLDDQDNDMFLDAESYFDYILGS